LEAALEELKKTLDGADFEAIKAAQEKVSAVASEAGGAMYAAAAAEQGAEGAPGATDPGAGADSADDTVVDAEVVDEGEDSGPAEGAK
jgi:molecular chaperone DnaK